MLREKLRNRKGFTLIEIIVVIVILAVLMAVAVPSVMSYMNEGNNAKYESIARAVLVRGQTDVAKAVSIGTIDKNTTDGTDAKGTNFNDTTNIADDLTGSHYGDAKVESVESVTVKVSGDDIDLDKIVCKIKLTSTDSGKTATISANKTIKLS